MKIKTLLFISLGMLLILYIIKYYGLNILFNYTDNITIWINALSLLKILNYISYIIFFISFISLIFKNKPNKPVSDILVNKFFFSIVIIGLGIIMITLPIIYGNLDIALIHKFNCSVNEGSSHCIINGNDMSSYFYGRIFNFFLTPISLIIGIIYTAISLWFNKSKLLGIPYNLAKFLIILILALIIVYIMLDVSGTYDLSYYIKNIWGFNF